jgi:hypothetical protein
MPVHISPASFTYVYFAGVLSAGNTSGNPVHCPPFALSAGDLEARRFDLDGQFFEITPSATGLPTMRDKDVWLYCVSWLANAMFDERHEDLSRNLRFTARDFLDFSKRGNGVLNTMAWFRHSIDSPEARSQQTFAHQQK